MAVNRTEIIISPKSRVQTQWVRLFHANCRTGEITGFVQLFAEAKNMTKIMRHPLLNP